MKKRFKDVGTTTILIDLNNAVYRSLYATNSNHLLNSDGIDVGCILGMVKILNAAIGKCKDLGSLPELVICEDRTPDRKRKLYLSYQEELLDYSADKDWDGKDPSQRIRYKGNRPAKDLSYDPVSIVKPFLSCLPCKFIFCEGEEADDVMASFIAKNPNQKVCLYSTDKDMWQLLKTYPNLRILIDSGNEPSPEIIKKNFDTEDVSKIALHKIIRGDSGDNVKSILRFPFKKNLDVFLDCDGTIEDFIRLLIQRKGAKSPEVDRIMKYLKVAILNQQLVKLRTNLKYEERVVAEPNRELWNRLCAVYETPSIFNSPLLRIY